MFGKKAKKNKKYTPNGNYLIRLPATVQVYYYNYCFVILKNKLQINILVVLKLGINASQWNDCNDKKKNE